MISEERIVQEYMTCGNYSETARRFSSAGEVISPQGIRARIIKAFKTQKYPGLFLSHLKGGAKRKLKLQEVLIIVEESETIQDAAKKLGVSRPGLMSYLGRIKFKELKRNGNGESR